MRTVAGIVVTAACMAHALARGALHYGRAESDIESDCSVAECGATTDLTSMLHIPGAAKNASRVEEYPGGHGESKCIAAPLDNGVLQCAGLVPCLVVFGCSASVAQLDSSK